MTRSFLKQNVWWLTTALAVLGLLGQFVVYRAQTPVGTIAHASWDFHPNSFDDVVNKADTIITGQVVSVAAGPDIVVAAKGEPSGEDRIPTQNVSVRVQGVDKGSASPGQTMTIFRTGGERHPTATTPPQTGPLDPKRGTFHAPAGASKANPNAAPPAGVTQPVDKSAPQPDVRTTVFQLDDDPAYQPGQLVYLLLRDGPNGTKTPVSPTGRYIVGPDSRLQAVSDQLVAVSVAGITLNDAHAAATGQLHIPNKAVQKRVSTGQPGMPTTGIADSSLLVLAGAIIAALFTVGLVLRRRRA